MRERGLISVRAIYDFIDNYHMTHSYAPSYDDISRGVNINKTTVSEYIKKMLDMGALETDEDTQKSIRRAIRVGKRP